MKPGGLLRRLIHVRAEMPRRTLGAAREVLRVRVADVTRLTQTYAELGLRVIRQTRAKAIVVLPCGIHLILSRPPHL
jgi:hypothetical protein